MAKNKKSKILASMLAVSTMAVFYAAPVMASNTVGIERSGETTTIENIVSVDKWGLKVLDKNGETVAYINSTNGGINAANGKFHVYSKGQIEGTALSLMNNGAQYVYIDNNGTARFGDVNGNNVRVEEGVLTVNRNSGQVAALGENGLTLTSSNNIRATLNAEQIANLNTTVKAGGVVDAKELNVTGAAGGLYVKDVTNENSITGTMIYTKAADGKTNTMWIDPNTGNLNTVGSIGVGSNLAKPVTQINGIADANGDGVGDINVGISYNEDGSVAGKKINLDASTGDINLVDGAKVDGVDVSELSKNVGDIGADLGDNGRLGGITRTDEDNDNKLDTTTIEGTTSFDANGMRVTNENDGRAVAITKDRGIEVFGGNGASNAVITNNGTARFGAEGGANVRIENGDVTSTYYDKDGNKGSYSLNTIGANTAGIERIQNSAGNDITEIEDTLRIYDNGTISTVNGEFRINEQGNVFANAVNVADGAVVISENSINAFGSKFTVNENGGVSTTGINVAKGMFTASDGGVTMANNNLSVDLNGNIKAGTYIGVKIGMNEDGDIILGNGTVIDDNFNSDNVAGITRKPLDDSAPGSGNTTYIEQNTAISADGIVVRDPESGVSTKTKYDGFYVKDEYGNNVSSLTQDKLNLAGENLAYKDSEGNINVTANTYTAGDVAGENVRVKADGIYVKDGGAIVSSLKDDGLMLTDQESGKQTLNATDIADIKGIDRSGNKTDGYTTTIEGATSFTKDGMTTNGLSVEGTYGGFHIKDVSNNGENNTMIYTTDQNGNETLYIDTQNGNLVSQGSLNVAGGRFIVDKDTGNMSVNAADGSAVFHVNGNDGTVHVGKVGGAQTVITGNSITTETLNVENIKLGNSMTDKDGNTITIGAAGVIDIEKDGNTVFHADTDNFEAHYDNYDLTLDGTNGFALSNETSSFTLNGNGFAFAGPVNLGAASDVKFGYTGNLGGYTESSYSLSQLVDTVNDIYDRTSGIYKDADGNTVISNEKGTWNEETKQTEYEGTGSKVTVGDNGTTFENGEGNGTTNINGSEIVSDATNVESGSGSGSGFGGGTSTTNGDNAVYVGEDGDYTHVSSDGVTIGDQTNTNTTNIDKDGMVVDGKTGNTHISEGGMTVTDKTDNSTTNIDGNGMVVNGSNGTTHISDSGMTVTGDNGTTNISGGDISVDNSVTVGSGENQTVVNNDGVTVGGEEGTSIKHDEISVGDGGYIGGGDVVSGEGVSLNQTAERVGHLENRVGELEDRIDKVGAMAAAIANLRTMGYDPAAPTEVAVGIGQYRDETGAALGLFHYPNRDFMLSLSVSTSGDEVMGGIGATWKFGRKSPEKVAEIKKAQAEADARRAEEAKLAKAEEMKQAAKEAKIKAQQERHAKLAAERAAQAEEAK